MKRITLALAILGVSLASFSQSETALSKARKQYQDENYPEALKLFQQAEHEEPANAQVPYLLAHLYSDMNDYKKCVTYFEKAIAMDSAHSNWIYECGLMYASVPEYAKSLKYLELAGAKGFKRTNDYLENLANAYMNTKQPGKAADLFEEVLKKKPNDSELRYQLGQAYYQSARYQQAINIWDELLAADKNNSEALYMMGLSYQKAGDKQKGQQLCDQAIARDPSLASKKTKIGGDF